MSDNEDRALVTLQASQMARVSPMDSLALMSEREFEDRLEALKLAQRRMERIQRELMTDGVDYGVIPGTGEKAKPTLLKPGAEKLCRFHRLVPTFAQKIVLGDGVTGPHIRVLTTCSLHYETEDGPIVAQGVGAANSWEKRYRYREGQRKCPNCGATAIIKGKAEYGGGFICWGKKGGCGSKFDEDDPQIAEQQVGQIENPDPYDTENTLEKISAKRAQIDATLRATATSGLFSQDLEDIVDAPIAGNGHAPEASAPESSNASASSAKQKPQTPNPSRRDVCSCGALIEDYTVTDPKTKKLMTVKKERLIASGNALLDGAVCRRCFQAKMAERKQLEEVEWPALWDEAQQLTLTLTDADRLPHPCNLIVLRQKVAALRGRIEALKIAKECEAGQSSQEIPADDAPPPDESPPDEEPIPEEIAFFEAEARKREARQQTMLV